MVEIPQKIQENAYAQVFCECVKYYFLLHYIALH